MACRIFGDLKLSQYIYPWNKNLTFQLNVPTQANMFDV
jgi:hypothetical protein